MRPTTHTSITLHPATSNDDGTGIPYHELWNTHPEKTKDGRTWDGEGIMGYLYTFSNGYVFVNEAGHPSHLFSAREDLIAWLQAKTPCLTWSEEPRR